MKQLTTRRDALLRSAAAALSPLAVPAVVRAQPALKTVAYGLTSKTSNDWVNFVADKLGFFTANGVKMDFIVTGSATGNGQQLAAGSLNLGGMASPFLIQGVIGGAPLAVVLARTRSSPYVIVARKGIRSVRDLKGKTVIVDAPSGITRLMVDAVLEKNGLRGEDVTYTFAGGTPERFAALVAGGVDAAMLLPPFSFRATGLGYPTVAEIPKFFPVLPVDQTVANVPWATANTESLLGYLRGYLQGARWIYDRANRTQATAILSDATNTAPDDAQKTYDVYVGGKIFSDTGITPFDAENKVLTMLAGVGMIKTPYPGPAAFVDNHYVQMAGALKH